MRLTILGCGASGGVPVPGLGWGDCNPNEPRNRRRRASLLVEDSGRSVLIDASPDCRDQLLDAGIDRLDAVLFTHAHADHCHGIDDLRWINMAMGADIPIHADARTLAEFHERFAYVFAPLDSRQAQRYYYKPVLVPHAIEGPFTPGGIPVVPFAQDHGYSTTLGFRMGQAAYSTDVVALDDAAFDILQGVDVWIVDSMRPQQHSTHSHLEQTLRWIERVRPQRAYLTHMNQTMDYAALRAVLPKHVEPAYDGLVIEV